MFTRVEVGAEDVVSCADGLAGSVVQQRLVGARRLALAVRWAQLHPPLPPAGSGAHPPAAEAARMQGRRGSCRVGGEGTPEVTEFATTELGMLLQTTTGSATRLLADALDLCHRLPMVWEAVLTGQVPDYHARQVAAVTRVLSFDQARWVDEEVVEALVGLPWGRAMAVVEAKVVAADPAGYEERRGLAENRRFVSTRHRSDAFGLRTLVARSTAGDIARLEAMIAHLAGLLQQAGDPDDADTRRAKALALLANPAQACVTLLHGHPATPAEPAESPSAVEAGAAVGRVLTEVLGPGAVERLRPTPVVYLHLAEEAVHGIAEAQVARAEDGGPLSVTQLRQWLATDRVVVRPVLDPLGQEPVDGYEIPTRLREATTACHPFETFPWGTLPARKADLDHTRRYDPGGPPGQTTLGNLGPLSRAHHRAKTFGGFTCYQPLPGLFVWRTPTGHWYRVDHHGTTALGRQVPDIITHTDPRHTPAEQRLRTDYVYAS